MNPRPQSLLMSLGSLVLAGLFLAGLVGVSLASAPSGFLVTRLTTSPSCDRVSFTPSLSADGTRVAFNSNADFLNQGISFYQSEIWLYDTTTMVLTRVTTSAANRWSCCTSLNGNGTKIAFLSDADLLNQGIPQGQKEVWLYDTTTLTFTRVTTLSAANRHNGDPELSADGTKVFFHSDADLLNQGIPQGQKEIWLYNTATMTFTRLTTSGDSRYSVFPSVNADGTKVVFHSDADSLNQGIPDDQFEVWLYDTNTLTVTRLTTSSMANRDSFNPSISPDGSKVAFSSDGDFLNQGIPDGHWEVWLYDTEAMTLTRLTTTASGAGGSRFSFDTHGSKMVFNSDADYFNQGIPPGQIEIWLYDTTAMTLTRLTTATVDSEDSTNPSMSADGRKIAFSSTTNFYNPWIPCNAKEIWLYESRIRYYLPLVIKR